MKVREILTMLDLYAEDYNFPILDNMNFDFAQGRLSVFQYQDQWAMIFEIVGVDPNLNISNDIFVYSNTSNPQGLIIGCDNILTLQNNADIFDDDGDFLVSPFDLNLIINEKSVHTQPTEEAYTQLGIKTEPFTTTKLARYLSATYKEYFWLDVSILLKEASLSNEFKLFYQTDEWQHTDEEKPSENEFFQSLAKAIELKDASLIQRNEPNTHWSRWTWSDFEKQGE